MAEPHSPQIMRVRPLEEVEREHILFVLGELGTHARAAGALGIGVRTLGLKLKLWREQGLIPKELKGRRAFAPADAT